jgi:hypothetical protein
MVAYLAFAPAAVATAEKEFQDKMAFARQPETHWATVAKAVQKVQSNPARMEQLRAAVRAEMAKTRDMN